ncbi:MAG: delta-60 repeat domain-containing protein [Thermoanaerobaculia bacterium]
MGFFSKLIFFFLFFPSLLISQYLSTIRVQEDGKILVGGYFSKMGGLCRNNIARLVPDGFLDESFVAETNDWVYALGIQKDGKIVIGGNFTSVNGEYKKYLARLLPDGSLDPSFYATPNKSVNEIYIQENGKILIGGSFTTVDGIERSGIARIDQAGMLDKSFLAKVDGYVSAIKELPDGKILIGGNFNSVNGVYQRGIARLYPDGTLDKSFKANIDYNIYTFHLLEDGKILAGGCISWVNGKENIKNLVRFYPDGAVDESFKPNPDGCVYSTLLEPNGRIFVAGHFFNISEKERNSIALINSDGSLVEDFSPKINDYVFEMQQKNNDQFYIIGRFTEISDKKRYKIALLNKNGTLDESFNANSIDKWVQVATNQKGGNGSWWKTDLSIQNVSSEKTKIRIYFHYPNGEIASTLIRDLNPLQQIYIKDVVGEMNLETSGALQVVANQEIILGAKVYNLTLRERNISEETNCQYFTGHSSDIDIVPKPSWWITGLKENEFFRSNLHITNIGNNYANFKIELFSSDGNLLSEFTELINPGEYKQFPQIFKYFAQKEDLEQGSIKITNFSAQPFISSASVIDNRTNEAVLIPAQEEKIY